MYEYTNIIQAEKLLPCNENTGPNQVRKVIQSSSPKDDIKFQGRVLQPSPHTYSLNLFIDPPPKFEEKEESGGKGEKKKRPITGYVKQGQKEKVSDKIANRKVGIFTSLVKTKQFFCCFPALKKVIYNLYICMYSIHCIHSNARFCRLCISSIYPYFIIHRLVIVNTPTNNEHINKC